MWQVRDILLTVPFEVAKRQSTSGGKDVDMRKKRHVQHGHRVFRDWLDRAFRLLRSEPNLVFVCPWMTVREHNTKA